MNKTIVNGVCLHIGLSSDPKPVDCEYHSLVYELDTGYLYEPSQYNEKTSGWFIGKNRELTLREVDYVEDVII